MRSLSFLTISHILYHKSVKISVTCQTLHIYYPSSYFLLKKVLYKNELHFLLPRSNSYILYITQ